MSITITSGEAISKHPLNSSVSKQMYSFPKEKRFRNMNYIGCSTFYYNLPSIKTTRGTSIGYGTKSDFTRSKDMNPPFYNVQRLFEIGKKTDGPAFTIGLGRAHFKKTVVENQVSEPENISPGPGKYTTTEPFGRNSPMFTMQTSNRNYGFLKTAKTPGPASYSQSSVNILGKYSNSKLKNSPSIGWSKAPRFYTHIDRTPGPNSYPPERIIGKPTIYNSKYASCHGRSFIGKYKGYRYTYLDDPGPGAYQAFSEFGIYGSKNTDDTDKKSATTRQNSEGKFRNTTLYSSSSKNINTTRA